MSKKTSYHGEPANNFYFKNIQKKPSGLIHQGYTSREGPALGFIRSRWAKRKSIF